MFKTWKKGDVIEFERKDYLKELTELYNHLQYKQFVIVEINKENNKITLYDLTLNNYLLKLQNADNINAIKSVLCDFVSYVYPKYTNELKSETKFVNEETFNTKKIALESYTTDSNRRNYENIVPKPTKLEDVNKDNYTHSNIPKFKICYDYIINNKFLQPNQFEFKNMFIEIPYSMLYKVECKNVPKNNLCITHDYRKFLKIKKSETVEIINIPIFQPKFDFKEDVTLSSPSDYETPLKQTQTVKVNPPAIKYNNGIDDTSSENESESESESESEDHYDKKRESIHYELKINIFGRDNIIRFDEHDNKRYEEIQNFLEKLITELKTLNLKYYINNNKIKGGKTKKNHKIKKSNKVKKIHKKSNKLHRKTHKK